MEVEKQSESADLHQAAHLPPPPPHIVTYTYSIMYMSAVILQIYSLGSPFDRFIKICLYLGVLLETVKQTNAGCHMTSSAAGKEKLP